MSRSCRRTPRIHSRTLKNAGPAILLVLLLRVSGVRLMEKDIGKRRPRYADYVLKTNAFFPGLQQK